MKRFFLNIQAICNLQSMAVILNVCTCEIYNIYTDIGKKDKVQYSVFLLINLTNLYDQMHIYLNTKHPAFFKDDVGFVHATLKLVLNTNQSINKDVDKNCRSSLYIRQSLGKIITGGSISRWVGW